MTALKARDIDKFIEAPGEDVVCALIYGPEQGLVHERAERLAKAVAEDLSDPWRAVSLSDQEGGDVARISDELAAQSFLGGRRVIRVRASGVATGNAVAKMLDAVKADALHAAGLLVVEAGDLKKSSALRKACEASPAAAAIACYPEGLRETKTAIRRQCTEDGLTLADDAAELLTMALGEDRGLLRQEVEKLILYVGPGSGQEITAEDVAACLAEAPAEDSFAVASLTLSGRTAALSKALSEAEASGTSVISLLRLTQNRILRLWPAAEALSQGEGPGPAMKKIRPPVFFKEQAEVERQLKVWPLGRLARAAAAVYEAEQACKRTGAPDQAIAERVLLSLAAQAAR